MRHSGPVTIRRDDDPMVFDRDHVLFGPLRDQVLDLDQVRRYGATMFGDPDAISLYDMAPREWFELGVRMLGRTAVECTRDRLAALIAQDVAELAATAQTPTALVLDLFAGSANTLYWLHRALPDARAVGIELDPVIHEHARHNLDLVGCPIELHREHYADALSSLDPAVPADPGAAGGGGAGGLAVVFIGPPWGHALDLEHGLDLDGTAPPVHEILGRVTEALAGRPLLIAVQAFERMVPGPVEDLAATLDWSRLSCYDLNPPGRNPATLLGTLGWRPSADAGPLP
jgi:hypothetical protein